MRRKPQKLGTVEVARTTVPLFFDRNELDFFAKIGLEEVRDPTAAGLLAKVTQVLKDWKPETWEGFIAISSEPPDGEVSHFIGRLSTRNVRLTFEFFRGEKAKKLDGEWVCRMHPGDREERCRKVRGLSAVEIESRRRELETRTERFWVPDDYVVVPYSEDVWARLCEAERQLREVRARIYRVVQSKQFLKGLTGAGGVLGLPERT